MVNVIKLERNTSRKKNPRLYFSKKLMPETLQGHKFTCTVLAAA